MITRGVMSWQKKAAKEDIERYRQLKQESAAIKALHEEYKAWSLWPWQKLLDEKLEMAPDPRKIMWYWSEGGNVGKSGMALWLVAMKNACLLEPSKKADMAHVFASEPILHLILP